MTSEADEAVIAAMMQTIAQVVRGNLRARVPVANDAPEALRGLANGLNELLDAWRGSELRARKTKRMLEEKVATIETQAMAIRELSVPVLRIWRETLLLPLVGSFDPRRAAETTNEVLREIVSQSAEHVIVDVTGVTQVDEQTASDLVRLVRSASLLGATCVVTGVSPSVAQLLVQLGSDLGDVTTYRTLEQGLTARVAPTTTRRV